MSHRPLIRETVREVALWIAASAFIFGIHAGTAVWVFKTTPPKVVVNEPVQSAIMIEMAPEPEAVETNQQDIAPEDVPEEVSNASKPVEQAKPEDTPDEQPVEEPDEPEPEVVETPVPETIKKVSVPVPMPAPRVKRQIRKKKRIRRKRKKRKTRKRANAQAKAAIKARVLAKKSNEQQPLKAAGACLAQI